MDCARAIVQAGIVAVFTRKPDQEFFARWQGDIDRALRLFEECNITYNWI